MELTSKGAAVVAFDVLFAEPDRTSLEAINAPDVKEKVVVALVKRDGQANVPQRVGIAGPRLAIDVHHAVAGSFEDHDARAVDADRKRRITALETGVVEPADASELADWLEAGPFVAFCWLPVLV